MTGGERIAAALGGQFADRPAYALTLPLYGANFAGAPLRDYYRDPELYRRGQAWIVERWDPDILYGPFALPFEARAWGATLSWTEDAPPNVRVPAGRVEALLGRKAPDPEKDEGLAYLVEGVRLLACDHSPSKPVAAIITSPSDLPAILLGLDAWLELFLFDPPLADRMLALCEEHFLALSEAYFAAGAAFVGMPSMTTNPKILPTALIKERIIPYLGRVFSRLKGPLVFHHGANPLTEYLPLVKDLPGIAGYILDERDDFRAARKTLGPGPLILGGITGPLMAGRSKDSIVSIAGRVLAAMAEDPGFVFATGAADIPLATPQENLDALVGVLRGRS